MRTENVKNSLGNDFWYKTMPVLIIGMIIWFTITLVFSGLLGFTVLEYTLVITVLLIISYVFLCIITIIFAFYKYNLLSMIFFFASSVLTGIIGSNIIIWAVGIIGQGIVLALFFMASLIGILVTSAMLILGLFLRHKISENFIYPLLVFGLILFILEFTLVLMFGFNAVILITSILVLIWLFGVILWDGSRLPETIGEGFWMLAVIDIFLDLVNVIIRIFIILVKIIGDALD